MWFKNILQRTKISRRRKSTRPKVADIENLESRQLLTVVWGNEAIATAPGGEFDTVYNADATLAQEAINHVISDWNSTIDTDITLTLTILAGDLSVIANPTTLGGAIITATNNDGVPTAATIILDDNAGGTGWYIDPVVSGDAEFSNLETLYSAFDPTLVGTEAVLNGIDFYTTVSHEIGHARGYANDPTLAINDFLTVLPNGNSRFSNTSGHFGIVEDLASTVNGLHSLDANDLMNATVNRANRKLISDTTVQILVDAYGYGFTLPSQRDTLHVSTDDTGDINVRVRDLITNTITVRAPASDAEFTINSTFEVVPQGINAEVTINGGNGDDTIYINDLNNFAVFGGSGTDVAQFMTGHATNMTTQVGYSGAHGGKTVSRHLNNASGPLSPSMEQIVDTEVLVIVGGTADDTIIVGNNQYSYVEAWGASGNDFINGWKNGTTTTGVLQAFGEAGNDVIWGTPNADILSGGEGNDSIWGGNGRDVLLGGAGFDGIGAVTANQSTDEDIVIGDITSYDRDRLALRAISAEWTSSRSKSTRMANISGTGSGTRLNYNYFFKNSGSGRTVFDDAINDIMNYYSSDWRIDG